MYAAESSSDLYLTSFYFTITTITTVGYGDFSASTVGEKIVCMFIMLAGVIAFSFASGSLSSYMAARRKKSEDYEDKLTMLSKITKKHLLSPDLCTELKKSIKHSYEKD